jgi:hypothetical protein
MLHNIITVVGVWHWNAFVQNTEPELEAVCVVQKEMLMQGSRYKMFHVFHRPFIRNIFKMKFKIYIDITVRELLPSEHIH